MAHDVYISHAHKDKQMADAICEKLENAGVKCWIAHRDISADEDWTVVTRNAIEASRAMVLMLSENANTAPHIEREIAHAFYTRRIIVPLRLTDTLPGRDLLFYLGNVRSYNAFGAPEERDLGAFIASINGLVNGHFTTREPIYSESAVKATTTLNFTDSWIGALRASHYQTLEILKRVAIVGSAVGMVWVFWFLHREKEHEASLAQYKLNSRQSGSAVSADLPPGRSEGVSLPKPAYSYTRFGLWVAPNTGTTPSVQREPQDALSITQETQPDIGTKSPQVASTNTLPADSLRFANRQDGHRGKSRPRAHERRVSQSSKTRIARLKSRLIGVWRQFVTRSRYLENR